MSAICMNMCEIFMIIELSVDSIEIVATSNLKVDSSHRKARLC